jgi:hypothetical protein
VPLNAVLLTPGKVVDLGIVRLRSDRAVAVRVVGYWAPGRHEPWWLATSIPGPPSLVVKLYDRRMTVAPRRRAPHLDHRRPCRRPLRPLIAAYLP